MALWNVSNNTLLREIEEGKTLREPRDGESRADSLQPIDLDVVAGSSLEVISGSLPPGMRITDQKIQGTAFEVARQTEFKFVLRATKDNEIDDRTFRISVSGADKPIWETSAGSLPVGNNDTFYILDNSPIDFQLIANDDDIEAGQTLEYFVASGDGELPPGIQLTRDGRIIGVVDPVLAIDTLANNGYYDTNAYGEYPFDFGVRSANGYDSFYYDIEFYDKSVATKSPKKLNRNYQFRVSVSDGDTIEKRLFRIFVVGDDFLRADNTIMQSGNTLFGADASHIRTPIWLTPADLGYRRADNYVTLYMDIIDSSDIVGFVNYTIQDFNIDGSESIIPPGLELDPGSGELAGIVPYQPNITKEYKFTVRATRYVGPATNTAQISFTTFEETFAQTRTPASKLIRNSLYEILTVENTDYTEVGASSNTVGTQFRASGSTSGNGVAKLASAPYNLKIVKTSNLEQLLDQTFNIKGTIFKISAINNSNPGYDVITLSKPLDAYLRQNETFTKTIVTSAVDTNSAFKDKTFTVKMLGKVDSRITWQSIKALGTINANLTSTLNIEATTSVPDAVVRYSKTSGRLPPGLKLSIDGEVFGKVIQFGENIYRSFWKTSRDYVANDIVKVNTTLYKCLVAHTSSTEFISDTAKWEEYEGFAVSGLTTFDANDGIFDSNTTSVDKTYTFTAQAEDQFGFSATTKSFTITINDPNDLTFSNLYVKPFLGSAQQFTYNSFISDPIVFTPSSIYRPNDSEFGLQKDLKMLVYAGIENVAMENFVAAAGKNHKKKQFKFGKVKTAVAYRPGTRDTVYEVVYVDIIDPIEATNGTVQKTINIKTNNKRVINDVSYEENDNSSGIENNEPNRFRPITNTIKLDSDAISIDGNKQTKKYISNLTNMRDNISQVGVTDNNFLPLWMRTPQLNNIEALGYVPCVVLAYCKEGTSQDILLNIKNNSFNFNSINFEIDRYIIDSTQGNSNEQYIVFANYDFNI
tara:strand:+ start:2783 stop:5728 length:2946 start_codon:yes stop_codon:yes gene_type:complete